MTSTVEPPSPSRQPTTLLSPSRVTLEDEGDTVVLPVGSTFLLALGGPPPDWRVSVGDPAVLAREVNVTVVRGAQGVYRALSPGVTHISATSVYPCQEAHPACMIATRAFVVTVRVVPAGDPAAGSGPVRSPSGG